MASEYGYITTTELISESTIDYTATGLDYTTNELEAVITQAERYINVLLGQSFSGTIPDGVKLVTLEIAKKIMHNTLLLDGKVDRNNFPQRYETYLTKDMQLLLEPLKKDKSATRKVIWT